MLQIQQINTISFMTRKLQDRDMSMLSGSFFQLSGLRHGNDIRAERYSRYLARALFIAAKPLLFKIASIMELVNFPFACFAPVFSLLVLSFLHCMLRRIRQYADCRCNRCRNLLTRFFQPLQQSTFLPLYLLPGFSALPLGRLVMPQPRKKRAKTAPN